MIEKYNHGSVSRKEDSELEGPRIDRRTSMKLLSAAGFSGFLAGCVGGDDQDGDRSSVDVALAYSRVEFLDPFHMRADGLAVASNIHTGLLKLNRDSEIVGDLAEDWEFPDETTITFHLKEDAVFHDGDPLDAEAAKLSLDTLNQADESRHSGKLDPVESVDAVDDTTLRLNLSEPNASLLAQLTLAPGRAGIITHIKARDEMGEDDFNANPVGSGPFEIADRTPGESITLTAFDDYWDTGEEGEQLPYLDEIVFNMIPESSTAWSALNTGQVQYATNLDSAQAVEAETVDGIRVYEGIVQGFNALTFLCTDPQDHPEWLVNAGRADSEEEVTDKWEGEDIPTTDVRVRQALSKAIDRDEVVETATQGLSTPARTILPPTVGQYYDPEPPNAQQFDIEGARELLDEAGYTGSPRFEGELIVEDVDQRVATVVQDQLARINVEVTLDVHERATFFDTYYSMEHLMGITRNTGMIDPWQAWWQQLHTPTGEAETGNWQKGLWSNEEFDQLIQQSSTTIDPADREQYIRDAEQIFLEEAPYAMVIYPHFLPAAEESLAGVENPEGIAAMGETQFED